MKIQMIRLGVGLWLATLSTLALACPACDEKDSTTKVAAQSIATLSPAEVQARSLKSEITVIDANPVDIFSKHHVAGAKRVEYDQLKATDLPADKAAPIVFYCMNERCGASPIAAKRARELGWSNVYLMPAGIQGWISAGLPVEIGD
jgi:rhodanese-related sulfurtransferase